MLKSVNRGWPILTSTCFTGTQQANATRKMEEWDRTVRKIATEESRKSWQSCSDRVNWSFISRRRRVTCRMRYCRYTLIKKSLQSQTRLRTGWTSMVAKVYVSCHFWILLTYLHIKLLYRHMFHELEILGSYMVTFLSRIFIFPYLVRGLCSYSCYIWAHKAAVGDQSVCPCKSITVIF